MSATGPALGARFAAVMAAIAGRLPLALGLDYRLARLAAAACECVYMYSAMRWLVFRDAAPEGRGAPANPVPASYAIGDRHEHPRPRKPCVAHLSHVPWSRADRPGVEG